MAANPAVTQQPTLDQVDPTASQNETPVDVAASVQPTVANPPVARPPSQRESHRARLQEDELGKLIAYYVSVLKSIGWPRLLKRLRGRGDLDVKIQGLHKAAPLLERLQRHGAPALLKSKPWPTKLLDARIKRGSHQSCQDHLLFLREELLDFMHKGFWLVLPLSTVKQLQQLGHLLGLRVSPMGVVPQRNRRPRLIVDLTFYGINADTINLAPKEAMQFGRTLERILYQIRHSNPRFGPVYLSKVCLMASTASSSMTVQLPSSLWRCPVSQTRSNCWLCRWFCPWVGWNLHPIFVLPPRLWRI